MEDVEEDTRSSLKKSLPHALQHSIEMVSLRTSAKLSGKAYSKMAVDGAVPATATDSAEPIDAHDDADDDSDTAPGSPTRGMRLMSSAHMELIRQLVLEQERASPGGASFPMAQSTSNRNIDGNESPRAAAQGTSNDDTSTLELCQQVVAGQVEHAAALLRRLTGDATECLLTLRTNMFWPMLARAVEIGPASASPILACLDAVAEQPLSAAVLEAQMLSGDGDGDDDGGDNATRMEQVALGLGRCGAPALPFALRLAGLAPAPDDMIEPLVDAILQTRAPLRALLVRPFAHAVLLATPNDQDLLERSALYLLGCGYLAELLFVLRVSTPPVRHSRKAVLDALDTTSNADVHTQLQTIWHHGLTTGRFDALRDAFNSMSKKRAAALIKHCLETAAGNLAE